MSDERHTIMVGLSDGYPSLGVKCPYAVDDASRPCWPWDVERDNPEPMPAPQQNCTYTDWCENAAPDELLYGKWEIEVGVLWEWGGDGLPHVRLAAPTPTSRGVPQ